MTNTQQITVQRFNELQAENEALREQLKTAGLTPPAPTTATPAQATKPSQAQYPTDKIRRKAELREQFRSITDSQKRADFWTAHRDDILD